MEQSILSHRGKTYGQTELKEHLQKLSKIEQLIFDARWDGLPFAQLPKDTLKASLNSLILRVAAIVGCELPSNGFYSDIVCEEVGYMVLDFFPDLTTEEAVLAVRLNAKNHKGDSDIEPIKFTGGNFNVSFLTRVLENFIQLRFIVDRKLQNYLDGY